MNYHTYLAGARQVDACIIGTGGFGRSFLAQGLRVPLLSVRVAIDMDADTAANAMREVGIADERVRICTTPAQAREAWDAGLFIAAHDLDIVIGLPFEVVVEATGNPEAGARYSRLAVEAGKHLALVSKEVDSVIGPMLAVMAKNRGRVMTPVDGDQPSLLIGLISWAQTLGFDILAAGKSSEYDFVYDPATGTLTSNGVSVEAPDFKGLENLRERDCTAIARARASAASRLPQRAVPDLCELTVVANATGLDFDTPRLHAPIARIDEVADFLTPTESGGILSGTGKLDVFHCLRLPGEVSFAGGVFVVVACDDAATWKMLEEKGHVVSRNARAAMIYIPRHLLGLEAATSILGAAIHGVSEGAAQPRHHADLVAVADADLPAGTLLRMGGHHHSIPDVSSAVLPAAPLAPETPAPFYLVSNRRLIRPVASGNPIRLADVEIEPESELLRMRHAQDAHFFAGETAKRAPAAAGAE